jgi:hypothetical protein
MLWVQGKGVCGEATATLPIMLKHFLSFGDADTVSLSHKTELFQLREYR